MSKTYTKDEVLDNGYHKISIYDVENQSLLSTYQTTPEGKKDGKEIEYFKDSKDIKRKTNWKNGEKTDMSEYDLECDCSPRLSKTEEYKNGECVKTTEYIYTTVQKMLRNKKIRNLLETETFLGKIKSPGLFITVSTVIQDEINECNGGNTVTALEKRSAPGIIHDLVPYTTPIMLIDGMYSHNDLLEPKQPTHIIKENGQYKHIEILGTSRGYPHVAKYYFYNMEFKDGKEYDGYCTVSGICEYHMKNGKLEGDFIKRVFDGHAQKLKYRGTIQNGIFTGIMDDKKVRFGFSDLKKAIFEGPYVEFFDKVDGKKKIEGFYKNGQKEGVWKYYADDGTVINQEYWNEGIDCTAKYETLKKVASKRIETEDKLSEGKDERVILPKMTAKEKRDAIREAKKDLSR